MPIGCAGGCGGAFGVDNSHLPRLTLCIFFKHLLRSLIGLLTPLASRSSAAGECVAGIGNCLRRHSADASLRPRNDCAYRQEPGLHGNGKFLGIWVEGDNGKRGDNFLRSARSAGISQHEYADQSCSIHAHFSFSMMAASASNGQSNRTVDKWNSQNRRFGFFAHGLRPSRRRMTSSSTPTTAAAQMSKGRLRYSRRFANRYLLLATFDTLHDDRIY